MTRDEMRKHITTSAAAEADLAGRTRLLRRCTIDRMDGISDRRRDAELAGTKDLRRFNSWYEYLGKVLFTLDEWLKS